VYYIDLLKAAVDQEKSGKAEIKGSLFIDVGYLWGDRAVIDENSHYGLGWVVTQPPGQGGPVGVNSYESPGGIPVIARGIHKSTRLVYHNGAMAGALSAVYLLPETQTAVVVLSNTFALCDAPDWVAQHLIEVILDSPVRNDFPELAKKAADNSLSHHPKTWRILAEDRVNGTKHQELSEYAGRYYNSIGNFYLDITVSGDRLRMITQGFPNVYYDLHHYYYDVFA